MFLPNIKKLSSRNARFRQEHGRKKSFNEVIEDEITRVPNIK